MLLFVPKKVALLLAFTLVFLAVPVSAQFVPAPELLLTKQHEGDFTFGGRHEYSLTVTNAGGTATTTPIEVVDTLPDGLSFVSMAGEGFVCDAAGQVVTCERTDALAAGGVVVLTLVVDVASDAPGFVTNEATVTGGGGGVPERPASDPTNILLGGLAITKQVDRVSSRIGDELTYTIVVENNSDTDAVDLQLVDDLNDSLEFVSAEAETGSCTGTDVVACDLGLLGVGQDVTVTIVARTLDATVLGNEASAYARGFALVTSDVVVTRVAARPHIEITKGATGSGAQGSTVTFTIEAANLGPGPATNLVITDVLPAGLTLTDIDPEAGMVCNVSAPPARHDPGPIVCSVEELPEGETATLVLTVRVRVGAPSYTNRACLVHDDTDPLARDLCAEALVSDPGFNPPGDSLPPPVASPLPTATQPPLENVSANPTATPTPPPTVVPTSTATLAPAPSLSTQGSQISPPQTGSGGLR